MSGCLLLASCSGSKHEACSAPAPTAAKCSDFQILLLRASRESRWFTNMQCLSRRQYRHCQLTPELAASMYDMHAYILILRFRQSAELRLGQTHVVSADPQHDPFSLGKHHANRPDGDLHLHDGTCRDGFPHTMCVVQIVTVRLGSVQRYGVRGP